MGETIRGNGTPEPNPPANRLSFGSGAAGIDAQTAGREGEGKFRFLFKHSPVPMHLAALPDGRLEDVNDAWLELAGLSSREEAIGKTAVELGLAEDGLTRRQGLGVVSGGGRLRDVEIAIRARSGRELFLLVSAEAVLIEGRQFALVSLQDITERKRMEESLRQQQSQLRLAMEAGKLVPWEIDLVTSEVRASPQLYAAFGLEPGPGLQFREQWRALVHEEDRGLVFGSVEAAKAGVSAHHLDYRIRLPDGSIRWHESHGMVIRGPDGQPARLVGFLRDVTERKQIEEALRGSEERVRRKLASVLSPEGDLGMLELADILDTAALQRLMDDFYALAGVPMSILDVKGRVLVGVGWQEICLRYHRMQPDACRHCLESDTLLSSGLGAGEYRLYKCKNNLWDMATPIVIGGQHLGNVFSGQFFFDDEPVDREAFRIQAEQFDFNEEQYLAALDRVPRLSRERVDRAIRFFLQLAGTISQLGFSNVKLARLLAERDRLTESLRGSEEFKQAILDSLPGHIAVLDLRGCIRHVNEPWLRFARENNGGQTGGLTTGADYLEVCRNAIAGGEAAAEAALRGIQAVMDKRQEEFTLEYPCHSPTQERWFLMHVAPSRESAGGAVISHTDITRRKQAEIRLESSLQQLRETQQELVRQERLATLGRLAGSVAHEIRTPLTVIQNAAFYLEQGFPQTDPVVRESLAEVKRAVTSADHIITEMLEYVREPAPWSEVFPIGAAAADALRSVPAPPGIRVRAETGAGIEVNANRDQITRILINLIQNAMQAMPDGGEVTIEAAAGEPGSVAIRVRDTGCGIPPQNLEKIFEPLFSTKVRGMGLGLAIALRYARMNGGDLTVQSEPGQGTTFELVLRTAA